MTVPLKTPIFLPAFPAHSAPPGVLAGRFGLCSRAESEQFDIAAVSEVLSAKAAEALKTEAWIAPKPGLVDRFDNGSHGDMDLSTFYRSAEAVSPYFGRMFECGFAASRPSGGDAVLHAGPDVLPATGDDPGADTGPLVLPHAGVDNGAQRASAPRAAFEQARRIGVRAEAAMYAATGGVNTHKGAIFTFGLLSTALGYLFGKEYAAQLSLSTWPANTGPAGQPSLFSNPFGPSQLLQCAAEMVEGIVERELSAGSRMSDARTHKTAELKKTELKTAALKKTAGKGKTASAHETAVKKEISGKKKTAGERLYKSCGMTGIRGEAERAYPSVLLYALPILESARRGIVSLDQAGVQALLHVMTVVEDTNLAARGGLPGVLYVQKSARRALSLGGAYTAAGRAFVEQMNRECVSRNLSPGGSADLLSATLFIDSLFYGIDGICGVCEVHGRGFY